MKCLDSNLLIDYLRGKTEALKKMKELENESLSTTSINVIVIEIFESVQSDVKKLFFSEYN